MDVVRDDVQKMSEQICGSIYRFRIMVFALTMQIGFATVSAAQSEQSPVYTGIPECVDISDQVVDDAFFEAFGRFFEWTRDSERGAFQEEMKTRLAVADCGLFFSVSLPPPVPTPEKFQLGFSPIYFFLRNPAEALRDPFPEIIYTSFAF